MEKFAVDLDAVLDEFEYHEDQVRNATKYCHHYHHLSLIRITPSTVSQQRTAVGFFQKLSVALRRGNVALFNNRVPHSPWDR